MTDSGRSGCLLCGGSGIYREPVPGVAEPLASACECGGYDGYLHVWECPWLLRPEMENRCGYISGHPGVCPYDHGEDVALVEIVATVQCRDCRVPIEREDCRGNDGRLICAECALETIR